MRSFLGSRPRRHGPALRGTGLLPTSSVSRRGHILTVLGGVAALGVTIFALGSLVPSSTTSSIMSKPAALAISSKPKTSLLVTNAQLAALLVRSGLGPGEIAAAGLSASDVATIVSNARGSAAGSSLLAAESDLSGTQANAERLSRLAESGRASAQDLQALTAARTLRDSQLTTCDSALSSFITAATGGLDQAKVAIVTNLRNNAGWPVPTQYKTVTRAEADWVALRDALIQQRVDAEAAAQPGGPPAPVNDFLAGIQSAAETTTALGNIQANGDAVNTAWNTALR